MAETTGRERRAPACEPRPAEVVTGWRDALRRERLLRSHVAANTGIAP